MNSLLFAIIGIQNLEITWETILNVGCPKSDSIRSVTPPPPPNCCFTTTHAQIELYPSGYW